MLAIPELPIIHRIRLGQIWWTRSPVDAAKMVSVVAIVLIVLYLTLTSSFLGLVTGTGAERGPVVANMAAWLIAAQGCAQVLYVVFVPDRLSHRFADPAWEQLPVSPRTLMTGRRIDALASGPFWFALLVNLAFYVAATRTGVRSSVATAVFLSIATTLAYQLYGVTFRLLLRRAFASRIMQGMLTVVAIAAYLGLATWAGRHLRDVGGVIDALRAFEPPSLLVYNPLWWPAAAARSWVGGVSADAYVYASGGAALAAVAYAVATRWVSDSAVVQVMRSSGAFRGRSARRAMITNEVLAALRSMRIALLTVISVALSAGTVAYLRNPNPVMSMYVLLPVGILTTGYTLNMLGAGGDALDNLFGQPIATLDLLIGKLVVALALYMLPILTMLCTALVFATELSDVAFVGVALCLALVSIAIGMPMSVRNAKKVSFDGISAMTANSVGNLASAALLFAASLAVTWFRRLPDGRVQAAVLAVAILGASLLVARMTAVSARILMREKEPFLERLKARA